MGQNAVQFVTGICLMFTGAFGYARDRSAAHLLILMIGTTLATVGGVLLGVRQVLRDEHKRRKLEQQPVLNI
jgi:hypothetical protein